MRHPSKKKTGKRNALLAAAFSILGVLGYFSRSYVSEKILRWAHDEIEVAKIPALSEDYRRRFQPEEPDWDRLRETRIEIRKRLARRDFPWLDSLLSELRRGFSHNPGTEHRLHAVFESFGTLDSSYLPHLDLWVETGGDQGNALAARSIYHCRNGWRNRGGKFANETSKVQFLNMEKAFRFAVEDAEAAILADSTFLVPYWILIGINRGSGAWDNGKALTEAALRICPTSVWVLAEYTESLLPRWGGSYGAMQTLSRRMRKVEELNPQLAQLKGRMTADRAHVLYTDKKPEEALAVLETEPWEGRGYRWQEMSFLCLKKLKRREEALASLEKAIEFRPFDVGNRLDRSLLLLAKKQVAQAKTDYATALDWNPLNSRWESYPSRASHAYLLLGWEESKREKWPQALAYLDVACEMDPKSGQNYYYRGRAKLKMGDFFRGIEDLDRSIALDPTHFMAYKTIDYALLRDRDFPRIIRYWDRYLKLVPTDSMAYMERAGTYFHAGDMGAALRDLDRSCGLKNEVACRQLAKWQGQRK